MADGTARPEDIAALRGDVEGAAGDARQGVWSSPPRRSSPPASDKLFIGGQWNALYQVAKLVREMGYSGKDFHPDNCIYVGGGLKRAQLPRRLPGVRPRDVQHPGRPEVPELQHAGAQLRHAALPEGRALPRAAVGRAVRPEQGRRRAAAARATASSKGRAAFFDLSLDGRWGGVITGDKISLDLEPVCVRERRSDGPRRHRALRGPRGRRQDRLRRNRRRLCERAVMNTIAPS